jgi:hypothetical protein
MSIEARSSSVNALGRVVVLVIAVLLGLFAGVLAVSLGVFLGRSWTIDAQAGDLIGGVLVFGGLLSACLYALFHSLVNLQQRLTGEFNSSGAKAPH